MRSYLLLLMLPLVYVCRGGKHKGKKPPRKRPSTVEPPSSSRRKRTDQAQALPAFDEGHLSRTQGEWDAMSPSVLRLIATDNHISITPQSTLSLRLFNHFQNQLSIATSTTTQNAHPPMLASPVLSPVSLGQMPALHRCHSPIPLSRNPFELLNDQLPPLVPPIATHVVSIPLEIPHPHHSFATTPPIQSVATNHNQLPATTSTTASVNSNNPNSDLLEAILTQNNLLVNQIQTINQRLNNIQSSHDAVLHTVNDQPSHNIQFITERSRSHAATITSPSIISTTHTNLPSATVHHQRVTLPPSIHLQNAIATSSTTTTATILHPATTQPMINAQGFLLPPNPAQARQYDDTQYRIPAIRKITRENIEAGKYVDLSLLASRGIRDAREGIKVVVDNDGDVEGQSLNITPKTFRAPIRSFHEWLTAFLVYAQTYLHKHPHKAAGVFAYIAQITRFASRYPIANVLDYDKKFRQGLELYHPDTYWGTVDSEIFDEYLNGRCVAPPASTAASSALADLTCYRCGTLGHVASACPRTATSSAPSTPLASSLQPPPFRAPQRFSSRPRATAPWHSTFRAPAPSAFSFQPPRPAPQPDALICHSFATYGSCTRAQCGFAHVCSICRKPGHSSHSCPSKR